ncbi:hypothetical protein D3C84_1170980 [compost metagenome]
MLQPTAAFDTFDEDHRIVIQLESSGEVVTQKEFGMNTSGSNSMTATDKKYQIEGISTTGLNSNYVEVKVYLSYQGAMKLLGESGVFLPAGG